MTDLQMTLLFPFIPIGIYLLFEYVFDRPDDDDDGGPLDDDDDEAPIAHQKAPN